MPSLTQTPPGSSTDPSSSVTPPSAYHRWGLRPFLKVGVLPPLLVLFVCVFGFLEPRFLSPANLINALRQSSFLMLVTIGQMVVILTRGLDMSLSGIIALSSVSSAIVMTSIGGSSPLLAILAAGGVAVLIGALVGAVNGTTVATLGVSPLIVTLGTASVTGGLALLLTGGAPVTGLPVEFLRSLGTARYFAIPVPVYIAALVVAIVFFALNRTTTGRYLYAIGGNVEAARLSGIRVWHHTVLAYVFSGMLAALAAVLLTARVSSGEPNLGGSLVLESITAAVLGGVSLNGGEGKLSGAVLGALFIALLSNGMNLIRVQSFYQMVALGVLLIIAVIVDGARQRLALRVAV